MGVVYEAIHEDGRRAALKVVSPAYASDPTFRARFRREIEISQKVAGPRTGAVLEADPDGDPPWLASEYIAGPTLGEAIGRSGPLDGDALLAFAVTTAQALAEIHAVGVVHRDLKPTNVILTPESPRVIDFGIAAAAEATSLTGTGISLGSAGWMSPEQVRGEPVTPASDVFAWGLTVAFAATGRSPFGSGRPEALAYRVVHAAPDLAGIPERLKTILEGALAAEPHERPPVGAIIASLTGESDAATLIQGWTAVPRTAIETPATSAATNVVDIPEQSHSAEFAVRARSNGLRRWAWASAVAAVALVAAGVTFIGLNASDDDAEPTRIASEETTSVPPTTSTTTAQTTTTATASPEDVETAWEGVQQALPGDSVPTPMIVVDDGYEAVVTNERSAAVWRWGESSGWRAVESITLPNTDGIAAEEQWPVQDVTGDGTADVLISIAYNDIFSSILTRHGGDWHFAELDGATSTEYSQFVNGNLITNLNVCSPSCADGNYLRVEWSWTGDSFAPNRDLTDPATTLARWTLATWLGIDIADVTWCEPADQYGYADFACEAQDRYFDVWLDGSVEEYHADGGEYDAL